MNIRLYKPSDRAAIRQLAYETAEAGSPSSFADPHLQMDLLTLYYTDREPESIWIAEQNGAVVGYLTGCLDTNRYLSWLKFRGHVRTILRVLIFDLFRPAIWRWARARFRTLREGGAYRPEWTKPYPAHLHMNLSKDVRGQGVGGELLKRFLSQCRATGISGIHLSTRADNEAAKRFFSGHGFVPVATINAYKPGKNGLEPVPVAIFGLKLPSSR